MFNKVRRWINLLFNKSKTIKDITKTNISEEHFKNIDIWKALYAGYLKEWHHIQYNTLAGSKQRTMKSLKMAKVSTEKLSKLIFTEKVVINIDDKAFGENIHKVLKDNRFDKVFQGKLEQMFALGGQILKAHPKELPDGSYKLQINYITPDMFIPLTYENGEVTEAAFINITKKGDKVYCLFEFHEWVYRQNPKSNTEDIIKSLRIRNELYEGKQNAQEEIKRIPLNILYPTLDDVAWIDDLTNPLFTYLRPNIANNFDLQSPLGISIYANATDTLFALDQAFDSFIREFKLGKRKIIVPYAAVRTVVNTETGGMDRYFDADDEAYQALNMPDPDKQKIIDNTVTLRVDEHVSAINSLLNLYATQIGFSSGTFSFDGQSVKTATEIVSEQSETYQTKQVNEELLEEGLKRFIHTLGEVAHIYDIFTLPDEYEVSMFWDDTIVKDKYTDSDFYIKLLGNSLMSRKRAIMKIMDVTEKEALDIMEEINAENATSNPDVDELLGDVE